MDILLFVIVVLQLIFMAWQEHKNREEREKLEMMIKSKDIVEFKEATEPPPPPTEVEEEKYRSLDEVPFEKLMNAEDNI